MTVCVLLLLFMVSWVTLQCVAVVFPCQTYLFFHVKYDTKEVALSELCKILKKSKMKRIFINVNLLR